MKNTKLFNNITGSYLIKGASLFISLFTMPAYMRYFPDHNVLGIWFTIVAIMQWVLTFDLGIGNGLRNKIVPALVDNDNLTIKKYISSAYIVIGIFSLCVMAIGSAIIFLLNWNSILNISRDIITNDVLKSAVILVFTGIIFQFFLRLITSILLAMQRTAISNMISLISSILILIYVSYFKATDINTSLMNLARVNILTVNIPLIVATFIVFSTTLKKSKPNIKYFHKDTAFSILKLGGKFFFIQIMLLFINSTNEILITHILGPEHVVQYQVYYKIFYLVVTLFSLTSNPIWSAVTNAHARKQYDWIVRSNKILIFIVLAVLSANTLLAAISQNVVNFWLKENTIKINYLYASIFVLYSGIMMFSIAFASVANGCGRLKCQFICISTAAIMKIPLVLLLNHFINGWICVVIANIIIMLPYLIAQPIIIKAFFKNKDCDKKLEVIYREE